MTVINYLTFEGSFCKRYNFMARSNFAKTLSDVSSSDGSLGRTLLENSSNTSQSGSCVNASVLMSKLRLSSKTPTRTPTRLPSTPSHAQGSDNLKKTPGCQGVKTSIRECGDRFIPNRKSTDIRRAQHELRKPSVDQELDDADVDYQTAVAESLNTNDSSGCRILKFGNGTREYKSGTRETIAVTPIKKGPPRREIPVMPEKVLDAPDILDDFYLNILDWSADNILAIALNQEVYLWNASSGDITCLMSAGLEGEYITSLKWSPDAPHIIAVGTSAGRVQLWNAAEQSLQRTMTLGDLSSAGRVPAVAWREHIVTSGSRSGCIRHHDIRIAHHQVGMGNYHCQEVCGLAWSPDLRFLASGANDNCVAVWSATDISSQTDVSPAQILRDHQAAVKAIGWCPWKPSLLCTGGGTVDHCLKFWNAANGNCVKSVDVGAQVSGIIWNSEYREIITGHGGPKNQLTIWKYPEISKVKDLMEHQGRVLCLVASPNNEMIATCASDETLRIWHCFQVDHTKKRALEKQQQRPTVFTRGLR